MNFNQFLVLAVATFMLITGISMFYHENVHKAVCEFYGGNATITYFPDIAKGELGITECNTNGNYREIIYFDSLTEIIGYHVFILVDVIVILFFILIYFWKFDKEKEFRLR